MMLLIIALLIGALVGIFGMMGMYSIFPDFIEPCLICSDKVQEKYDQLRQTFSVLGWFFAFIPVGIIYFYISQRLQIKVIEN